MGIIFYFLTGSVYLIHAWWRWSKRTRLHLPPESIEEKTPLRTSFDIFNIKSFMPKKLRLTRQHGRKHHPRAEVPEAPKAPESGIKKKTSSAGCAKRRYAANPRKMKTFLKILIIWLNLQKNGGKNILKKRSERGSAKTKGNDPKKIVYIFYLFFMTGSVRKRIKVYTDCLKL